jgi:hypothetical protein
VGLFDFFKRRRDRESAIPTAPGAEAPAVESTEPGEVVGERFPKRHGIDPDSAGVASGTQIDASSMPAMQAEMLEALRRHGPEFADVQIEPSDTDSR